MRISVSDSLEQMLAYAKPHLRAIYKEIYLYFLASCALMYEGGGGGGGGGEGKKSRLTL